MRRIGIAASKISKDNLVIYNAVVLILATLFALLIVFLSGFSIFTAIFLIHGLSTGFAPFDLNTGWGDVLKSCLVALALVGGVFILCAAGVNVKLK